MVHEKKRGFVLLHAGEGGFKARYDEATKMQDSVLTTGIPTLAVLVGILVNNSRLSDTNQRIAELNGRIGEVNGKIAESKKDILDVIRAEMKTMEAIMDARFSKIEEVLRIR